MDTWTDFEVVGERGYFRPRGSVSLDQAVNMIDAALRVARTRGLREMVVNVTGLTGFVSPPSATATRSSASGRAPPGGGCD